MIPEILSLGKVANFVMWSIASYEFLLISMLLFFYLPVINYINNVIYKTKNMLSIIPLSILASQNGVYSLLDISNEP